MKESKWFPGHMKSAMEDIEETKIKLADCILYVLDARAGTSLRRMIDTLNTQNWQNIVQDTMDANECYPSQSGRVAFYAISNSSTNLPPISGWYYIIAFRAQTDYVGQIAMNMTGGTFS